MRPLHATNQQLITISVFHNYPLICILRDYQGHTLDIIQGDNLHPSQLPHHSSCPKKQSKPHATL